MCTVYSDNITKSGKDALYRLSLVPEVFLVEAR